VLGASQTSRARRATGIAALAAVHEVVAADAKNLEQEHFVVCAGGELAQAAARSSGLRGVIPLGCALGDVTRGAAALRRVMAGLGRLDQVVSWGEFAGDVAFKVASGSGAAWWCVNVGSGMVTRLDEQGEASDVRVALPWRTAMQRRGETRAAARERVGLPAGQMCMGLLADAHANADATEFMLCASVLHAAGQRLSAIVPWHLATAERARLHLQLGTYARETAFVMIAGSAWVGACDVVVLDAGSNVGLDAGHEARGGAFVRGLLVCEALAADCAVIMTRATQQLLGLDQVGDLAAASGRATDIARIALPLFDDAKTRREHVRRYREAVARVGSVTLGEGWFGLARAMV
jgi:hypothetical protein